MKPSAEQTNEYKLGEAAANGKLDLVKELIQNGVDINSFSNSYEIYTPITIAANENQIEIVKCLINHGADIDLKEQNCGNALFQSAFLGFNDIVLLLLENGADPNIIADHSPILYQLVFQKNKELIELLIKHGVDVNLKTREFSPSICEAIKNGDTGITELLLKNGAKTNSTSVMNAACRAAEKCDCETIKILLENSSWKPNPKKAGKKQQAGPLHYAIKNSCINLVRLLIEHNADVNLFATHSGSDVEEGIWDKKPLQLVKFLAHPELVEILKDAGAKK